MLRTIMVPLDGSPFSEQALPVAAEIARRVGGQLRLVHVHEPLFGEVFEEIAQDEQAYLDGLAGRVARESGVRVGTARLAGRVADQLRAYVEANRVDLVVMTTHGRSGLTRTWLGSVTDGLVREVRVPVLALRPVAMGDAAPGAELFSRVLIPLDGSERAEAVLDAAAAVGGPDASYTLVRAVAAPLPMDPTAVAFGLEIDQAEVERREAEAAAYLEAAASRFRRRAGRVEIVARVDPRPAAAILDLAEEMGTDLIAMATHGRGGMRRLVLGSVADKVLRGASAAVLVLRPEDVKD